MKSLIFDIDGTLWDSRALVAEGYNIQLCAEGYDHLRVNAEVLRPLFGKTMAAIADVILAEVPVPERYALMERCMETENRYLAENECRIGYEGVKETLEVLKKDYRLFIVSNAQCGYPELCMEKLGIAHLFEGHLCYGDTGTEKGQTILTLMRRHNITDGVYIGDTQGDYEATVEAGVPFIWAAFGFGNPQGYAARLDDFRQLPELMQTM
ncbi:MAG: HAD family hydrolase [Oscillospiraceae bacterium]|nr:HAD family hydrolase [Oscillospiraceae bacterium]